MSKQMICPKAKECGEKCPNPYHQRPHLFINSFSDNCIDARGGCPACVEVEPQQEATIDTSDIKEVAKEASNAISEHPEWNEETTNAKKEIANILRKYDCLMIPVKEKQLKEELLAFLHKEPSQVQEKQCPNCGHPLHNSPCHAIVDYGEHYCGCKSTPTLREQMPLIKRSFGHNNNCTCTFCLTQMAQRDADMAWYKAKLEEIAEGIATICSGCEGDERQREHFKAYVLEQREG